MTALAADLGVACVPRRARAARRTADSQHQSDLDHCRQLSQPGVHVIGSLFRRRNLGSVVAVGCSGVHRSSGGLACIAAVVRRLAQIIPPAVQLIVQGIAAHRIVPLRIVLSVRETWALVRESLPQTAV